MQETLIIPTPWLLPPRPASGSERGDPTLRAGARSIKKTLVHETKKKKREEKERKNNKKKMLYAVCACAAEL